jgi:regulator of protease activity HflC (stomatin/prohibitin superfamily)
MPAKRATAKRATAKRATAKKATAKKATAKKATAKKATAKKARAKKATAKKATARAASQPKTTPARRAGTPSRRGSTLTEPGRSGDPIIIDSTQVGSPPREGEILEVIQGEVSVSYRVRWADGHETLIAPKSGTARIVRAPKRA